MLMMPLMRISCLAAERIAIARRMERVPKLIAPTLNVPKYSMSPNQIAYRFMMIWSNAVPPPKYAVIDYICSPIRIWFPYVCFVLPCENRQGKTAIIEHLWSRRFDISYWRTHVSGKIGTRVSLCRRFQQCNIVCWQSELCEIRLRYPARNEQSSQRLCSSLL